MQFDYRSFHVNCVPRVIDGEFVARARIVRDPGEGERRGAVHQSVDPGSFPLKEDVVIHARAWAIQWCDENWA